MVINYLHMLTTTIYLLRITLVSSLVASYNASAITYTQLRVLVLPQLSYSAHKRTPLCVVITTHNLLKLQRLKMALKLLLHYLTLYFAIL